MPLRYKELSKPQRSPTTPPPQEIIIEFFVNLFLISSSNNFSRLFKFLFTFFPSISLKKTMFPVNLSFVLKSSINFFDIFLS